jgi:hypothetical protein
MKGIVMSRYKEMDIAIQTMMAANPIADPLANAIEDEHLELHYDYLCEQGYDEDFLKVIDTDIYASFWENLTDNFDKFFLDNGIAVHTYENDDYQLLSSTEKAMVDRRFATAMLEQAKKEIQQRIDMAILGGEM